eukprot:TRINITY_DN8069_c0_g1_i4.p2 TRINITY_DN8069_c0_g1~~TRINITY_DN8069_c0_g1_i4.p2  ORF type:complete len:160 (-),score=37.36 TRINITY_DN8069_c0_g1_i4:168-647(-)
MEDLIDSANLSAIQGVEYQNALEVDYAIRYMEDKLGIQNGEASPKRIAELNKQHQQQIVKDKINEKRLPESANPSKVVKSFDVFSTAIADPSSGKSSPHPRFLRKLDTQEFSKSIAILPDPAQNLPEALSESQDQLRQSKLQLNYQQFTLKPIGCIIRT